MKEDDYLRLIHGEEAHDELMKSELYRRLFGNAVQLINDGYNPFTVAIALARLTSVILEGIDSYASSRKRPS